MPMNLDAVGVASAPVRSSWTSKDALLYAVGVGAGQSDPTGFELEFTTENSQNTPQRVLPTFPVSINLGIRAMQSFGEFDPAMVVHGEQAIEILDEIPPEATIESVATLVGIYDKGSGALAVMETDSRYLDSGQPAFKTRSSAFIRGEGGFGDNRGPGLPSRSKVPDGAADVQISYPTRTDQALLYRLAGDRNPLHSDPVFAATAGFSKPILHGLCTYGFTGRALLHGLCGSDASRFRGMDARFTRPVMPGDTLTVKMWRDGAGAALFQTVTQDGTVVIDGGCFTFT